LNSTIYNKLLGKNISTYI